jgi:hypothetical protein
MDKNTKALLTEEKEYLEHWKGIAFGVVTLVVIAFGLLHSPAILLASVVLGYLLVR